MPTTLSLDLTADPIINLSDLGDYVPSSRGRRISMDTALRWAKHGVRGRGGRIVKLETFFLAGRRVTTKQRIERFILEQQTAEPVPAGT